MPYKLPNGKYPYPLNFLASDGGLVPQNFVFGNPSVEPDSTNWFILCLTPEDMIKVKSLVEVGAPIAFPDSYNYMFYLFDQMFQFPNQIPEDSCMDLCQLIIDCIENTPALQEKIAQYSNGSSIPADAQLNEAIGDTNTIEGVVTCDLDNLFGAVTGIVDLYNNLATDLIQQLVSATNTTGRLGDVIEAIPVIGVLPADDALQFVESFMEDIQQNYESAYTEALRDEYRCEIFCGVTDTCVITFADLFQYFANKLVTSVTTIDVTDFIEYFAQGTFAGEELVHAFHCFVAGIFYFGGEMLGIDSNRLIRMVSALYNDPDSDWIILCDECNPEPFEIVTFDDPSNYDVTQGTVQSTYGNPVPALRATDFGSFFQALFNTRQFEPVEIEGVTIDLYASGSTFVQVEILNQSDETLTGLVDVTTANNAWQNHTFNFDPVVVSGLRVRVFRSTTSSPIYACDNLDIIEVSS